MAINYEQTLLTNPVTGGVKSMTVPVGTTAERPASPAVGMLRYNTDLGVMEQYTSSGWMAIAAAPGVSGIGTASVAENADQTIIINGSNFTSSVTVKFVGNNGTEYTPTTTTRNSSSQITCTFTGAARLLQNNEPYDVKITNNTGLTSTLENVLDVNAPPAFSTAANLGSFWENLAMSFTVSASDPDGSGITYSWGSVAGNGGTGYGSGSIVSPTLNATSGAVTGTAPNVTSNTVVNLTICATDGSSAALKTCKDFYFTSLQNSGPTFSISSGTTYTNATMSSLNFGFTASDPEGHGVTVSVAGGSLPTGLSLGSSGTFSGTVQSTALSGSWSSNYPITARATDTLLGDYSDITVNVTMTNSYYYRRIYSHGYVAGGYYNSSPHTAAHRMTVASNTYAALGDKLDAAAGYVSGTWGDTHMYLYGTGSALGAYSHYSGFNMSTETNQNNGDMGSSKDDACTMGNHGGYVGVPSAYTTMGGNSTTVKHTFSSNTCVTNLPASTSDSYGNGWQSETYGYDAYYGQKMSFSADTWSAFTRTTGSNQAHSKALSTKNGYALIEVDGNSSSNYTKYTFSSDSNQTGYSTKPTACGETNYTEGQDWGYGIGCCGSACQNGWMWYQYYASDTKASLGNADRNMSSGDGGSRHT